MKRPALAFLVSATLACACAGGNAPSTNPYATATIPATPPPVVDASSPIAIVDSGGVTADAGADHAPPFAVAKQPLPVVPIADRGRDAWPKKALPNGKRLARGGVVPPGIPGPDRVAIATTDKKGLFVDARTGAVLATLPAEPEYVSPKAGAVTLTGKPPRLLRAYDAKVVTPALVGADQGERLVQQRLAAIPEEPRVIAVAETGLGEKLAGFSNDDFSTFTLSKTPFGGMARSYVAILSAREWQLAANYGGSGYGESNGTPFPLAHEVPCLRARMEKDGTSTCIEYLPSVGMEDGVRWLDEGFFSMGGAIGHPAWGNRTLSIADRASMCFRRGARATPPRIVAACHKAREAFLWAPGRLFTFQGPPDPNDVGGLIGADVGYVLPMPDLARAPNGDQARPTSRWLDLVGMRLLTSTNMLPLTVAAFAGMEPVGLGSTTENKVTSVWAIDFDAPARDLVSPINDCPGQLGELREDRAHGRKRYLVLACMTPPPAHTVAQNLIWAEILDTEKKVRWRTPLMPELFFPDGVVVLSTRRALSAESKTAPGELTSVDLASL